MVFGRGFLWVLVRLFVFYEACSPLPMGEGPGVRSGFGEAFRVWLSISWVLLGISCLAEAFRRYWWAFRRYWWAFRGYWWAFRVLLSIS